MKKREKPRMVTNKFLMCLGKTGAERSITAELGKGYRSDG